MAAIVTVTFGMAAHPRYSPQWAIAPVGGLLQSATLLQLFADIAKFHDYRA